MAEQQLVASLPAEKGRDLLKQVRIHLVETARPIMEAMIQEVTGVKVVSLHHDISTVTGEEVILFTLAEMPTPAEQVNYSTDDRWRHHDVGLRFDRALSATSCRCCKRSNRRLAASVTPRTDVGMTIIALRSAAALL